MTEQSDDLDEFIEEQSSDPEFVTAYEAAQRRSARIAATADRIRERRGPEVQEALRAIDEEHDETRRLMPNQLQPGTLVTIEVTAHQPWGFLAMVVLEDPEERLHVGSVDAVSASDIRPFVSVADLPPVGERLNAVVLPYPPNGQLRFSIREADVNQE